MGGFPLVHPFRPALVDDALAVAHDDMVVAHAHRLDELGAGDRRRAGAVHDDADVLQIAAGEVAGVDQAGGGDDRGAVLVVVEDRDVHPLLQRLLDDEAGGGGDVFQVDPAEARLEQSDRVDEGVDVFGRDFEVDRIDVGEALEQHRFAFHHRLRGKRAEIAEAEDGGAVRDDGHEITLGGIIVSLVGILGDRPHRHRDSGRISEAQIALRRHRLGRDDLDLPGPPLGVEVQRFLLGEFDVAAFAHPQLPAFAAALGF